MNTTLEKVIQEKHISKSKMRENILDFENALSKVPGIIHGDSDFCPLKHSFSDGIYVREIFIPKGAVLTGKIHKHEHPNFLMSGEVTVVTESGGRERLKGPRSMISSTGTKRVVIAHTDTVWITVHHNPDNTQDLKKLEDIVIAKNYLEYKNFQKQISAPKTEINNCGLDALKKLSNLKKTSIRTLIDLAEDNGLTLYPYAISTGEEMMTIPFPAIVHSENHFDYVSKKEDFNFEKEYTGYVLLTQKAEYKKIKTDELKNITGETWVALVGASIALTGTIITTAAKSVTECGKNCRAECKGQYKFFQFKEKNQCVKKCKPKCINESKEVVAPARESQSNTGTYIMIGVIVLVIGGLVWWALKKK